MTNQTLQVGTDHLRRLAALTNGPVGLENLAFAFGTDDVWTQGDFLDSLLAPVDGFLVLDVHNLWCQMVNFDLDAEQLLATYPVNRVRECHVSGGSWSTSTVDETERTIRRDTHDDAVPDEVFELLDLVLASCPNVETVIVEQIGDAFASELQQQAFRIDFQRVRDVVAASRQPRRLQRRGPRSAPTAGPTFPAELMNVLDCGMSPDQTTAALRQLDAAPAGIWHSWVDQMDPHMVATASELMATWGRRN